MRTRVKRVAGYPATCIDGNHAATPSTIVGLDERLAARRGREFTIHSNRERPRRRSFSPVFVQTPHLLGTSIRWPGTEATRTSYWHLAGRRRWHSDRQIGASCLALTAAKRTHLFAISLVRREANRSCEPTALQGKARMASVLDEDSLREPSNLLMEVVLAEGRTRGRAIDDVYRVTEAVGRLRRRCRVAFEGTLGECVTAIGGTQTAAGYSSSGRVVRVLDAVVSAVRALIQSKHLDATSDVIVSAGGSTYFDLIVDKPRTLRSEPPRLNSCYAVGRISRMTTAYVIHLRHSNTKARRDRRTSRQRSRSGRSCCPAPNPIFQSSAPESATCEALSALLRRHPHGTKGATSGHFCSERPKSAASSINTSIDPNTPTEVADLSVCTRSHPSTALESQRLIPVVGDNLTIIDVLHTLF